MKKLLYFLILTTSSINNTILFTSCSINFGNSKTNQFDSKVLLEKNKAKLELTLIDGSILDGLLSINSQKNKILELIANVVDNSIKFEIDPILSEKNLSQVNNEVDINISHGSEVNSSRIKFKNIKTYSKSQIENIISEIKRKFNASFDGSEFKDDDLLASKASCLESKIKNIINDERIKIQLKHLIGNFKQVDYKIKFEIIVHYKNYCYKQPITLDLNNVKKNQSHFGQSNNSKPTSGSHFGQSNNSKPTSSSSSGQSNSSKPTSGSSSGQSNSSKPTSSSSSGQSNSSKPTSSSSSGQSNSSKPTSGSHFGQSNNSKPTSSSSSGQSNSSKPTSSSSSGQSNSSKPTSGSSSGQSNSSKPTSSSSSGQSNSSKPTSSSSSGQSNNSKPTYNNCYSNNKKIIIEQIKKQLETNLIDGSTLDELIPIDLQKDKILNLINSIINNKDFIIKFTAPEKNLAQDNNEVVIEIDYKSELILAKLKFKNVKSYSEKEIDELINETKFKICNNKNSLERPMLNALSKRFMVVMIEGVIKDERIIVEILSLKKIEEEDKIEIIIKICINHNSFVNKSKKLKFTFNNEKKYRKEWWYYQPKYKIPGINYSITYEEKLIQELELDDSKLNKIKQEDFYNLTGIRVEPQNNINQIKKDFNKYFLWCIHSDGIKDNFFRNWYEKIKNNNVNKKFEIVFTGLSHMTFKILKYDFEKAEAVFKTLTAYDGKIYEQNESMNRFYLYIAELFKILNDKIKKIK